LRTCKACGEKKRVLTRAVVFHVDGTPPGGGLVCQTCARVRGILVVASKVPPVTKGDARPEGLARAIRQLHTLAKLATAGSEPADGHAVGRAEGFEGAIEVLKRECS
jgi:hypothetical protein